MNTQDEIEKSNDVVASETGSRKSFSLDNYLNKDNSMEVLDALDHDEVFERGFGAYQYPEGIFLTLKIKTKVKTTCPINGSEDIIKVKVEYQTNRFGELIEHHSFISWLDSFESKGLGLEATVDTVYEMVDKVCSPSQLKVTCKSHSNFRAFNTAFREKN